MLRTSCDNNDKFDVLVECQRNRLWKAIIKLALTKMRIPHFNMDIYFFLLCWNLLELWSMESYFMSIYCEVESKAIYDDCRECISLWPWTSLYGIFYYIVTQVVLAAMNWLIFLLCGFSLLGLHIFCFWRREWRVFLVILIKPYINGWHNIPLIVQLWDYCTVVYAPVIGIKCYYHSSSLCKFTRNDQPVSVRLCIDSINDKICFHIHCQFGVMVVKTFIFGQLYKLQVINHNVDSKLNRIWVTQSVHVTVFVIGCCILWIKC